MHTDFGNPWVRWLNLHGIVSESSCEFNGFTNHVGFIVVTTLMFEVDGHNNGDRMGGEIL